MDIFLMLDPEGSRILDHNESALQQLRYSKEELSSVAPSTLFPQLTQMRLEEELSKSVRLETLIMRSDGSVFAGEILCSPGNVADEVNLTIRDVTKQVQVESELRRAKRSLSMLSLFTKSILAATSEEEMLGTICQKMAEVGDFAAVFAICRSTDDPKSFSLHQDRENPLDVEDVLDELGLDDGEKTDVLEAKHNKSVLKRARPQIGRPGTGLPRLNLPQYGAMMYLPMRRGGKVLGGLCVLTKRENVFDEQEIPSLEKCASELAFGIESQQLERIRARTEEHATERLKVESAIARCSADLLDNPDFASRAERFIQDLKSASSANQAFLYAAPDDALDTQAMRKLCEVHDQGIPEDSTMPTTVRLPVDANSSSFSLESVFDGSCDGFSFDPEDKTLIYPMLVGGRCIGFAGFVFLEGSAVCDALTETMLRSAVERLGELRERCRTSRTIKLLAIAMDNTDEGVLIAEIGSPFIKASIVLVNDGLCKMTGFNKSELLGGTPELLQTPPNLLEPGTVLDTLRSGKVFRGKGNYRRKDGSSFVAEHTVYPIYGENRKIAQYLCIYRDVTEKISMESRLAFANKMESVGQLSAGIAHEINTPSQFISDNLSYLQDAWKRLEPALEVVTNRTSNEGDERRATQLRKIVSNFPGAIADACEGVDRIASIVKAMREFSHPGKGFTLAEINKCISMTVTVARNEWKYVCDVEQELDPSLPLIEMMPGDINQVLLNLIVNAAHAIEDNLENNEGRGVIRITSRIVDEHVRVSISDTGKGIPERIRESIFDPFFTTKEIGKGTGQGLFMAHSIIEQRHKGRLWFDSEENKGTTFHFDLPLTKQRNGSIEN